MDSKKVYFGRKLIIFSEKTEKNIRGTVITDKPSEALEKISGKDVTSVVITSPNPEKAFSEVFQRFKSVRAGGGVVINSRKELLLIFRRNFWDLPKGHLDARETIEECALREVKEETGISGLRILEKAGISYHVYTFDNKNILKETYWFLMSYHGEEELLPQTDEDIQKAEWIKIAALPGYLPKMYSSLQDMLSGIDFTQFFK